jgi:hypothetical protein
MGDWSTLETVLFFAVALPLSIVTVGILVIRAKKSSIADKIICAGAIAAIISTFLPWYHVEFVQFSLWDTNRVAGLIILIAGAEALAQISMRVILFGRSRELGSRGPLLEGLVLLAASGLAVVFAFIRWSSIPSLKVEFGMTFVYERSWGPWIGIVAALIFVTGSMMKFLEDR